MHGDTFGDDEQPSDGEDEFGAAAARFARVLDADAAHKNVLDLGGIRAAVKEASERGEHEKGGRRRACI